MTRRRWLRFSLRALLLLTLLAGIVCGWLGTELARMRRERLAVAKLKKIASIYFHLEPEKRKSLMFPGLGGEPPPMTLKQKAVRQIFGKPYHQRVADVFLWGAESRDTTIAKTVDLSLLRDFDAITDISIRNVSVRNAQSISHLRHIRSLTLVNTGIEDVTCLNGLTRLLKVNVSNNRLTQLPSLNSLSDLNELDLSNTRVHRLDSVHQCVSLESLWLTKTIVSDLGPLMNLRKLVHVDVGHTKVTNAQALHGKPALSGLVLTGCQVDRMPLLPSLTYLDISDTKISSLAFVRQSPKITGLITSGTPIMDLRPLERLPLVYLGLGKTKVRDVTPLLKIKTLTDLWIFPGSVSKSELRKLKKELPELIIHEDHEGLNWDPTRQSPFVIGIEPVVVQ